MNDAKMITGKFSRSLKTTAMVTQTSVKHLGYLASKKFSGNSKILKEKHEQEIGKILFRGLSQMRGTALKASQLLSLEADLLPKGIRDELTKSCYQVPPINRALIRKAFIQEFRKEPNKIFEGFESLAFAAASLGQVHRATLASGELVAVKVQYPGISEAIDSDLKILSFILSSIGLTTNYLPNKDVINTTVDEITNCLKNEIDYELEAESTQWFYEKLKEMNIRIPKVYTQHSSKKILCTEFLQGKHIDEWLADKPTQEERNKAGQIIFDAFLYSFFHLKAIHADPHMGNYLFLDTGEVGLLDFGCVKHIEDDFSNVMADLISGFINGEQKNVLENYKRLKLFRNDLPFDTYVEDILPILEPLQKWMSEPYKTDTYDFSKLPAPPLMDHDHQTAVRYLANITRDQMYFDRSFFGVFQMLRKIGANIRTKNDWIGG